MLASKNAKIFVTPNANIKFALPPAQNPNVSQWNIGAVEYGFYMLVDYPFTNETTSLHDPFLLSPLSGRITESLLYMYSTF